MGENKKYENALRIITDWILNECEDSEEELWWLIKKAYPSFDLLKQEYLGVLEHKEEQQLASRKSD